MNRGKKLVLWLVGVFGIVALALIAGAFLLPRLISQERLERKILEQTSRVIDGQLTFQSVSLALFPLPRVVLQEVKLDIPGKAGMQLPWLTVKPKALPLLWGRVEIAGLSAYRPLVQLRLEAVEPEKSFEAGVFVQTQVNREVLASLLFLAARLPGVKVGISDGELDVYLGSDQEPLLQYQHIGATLNLATERLKANMSCRSSLGETISASGWLDPRQVRGEARLDLTDFQPHKLATCLFGLVPQVPVDSSVNLHLEVTLQDLETIRGSFRGSAPVMQWGPGAHHLDLNCERLEGNFRVERDRMQIEVEDLAMNYPGMHAKGALLIDRGQPLVTLDFHAWDVDASSVRQAALTLLGNQSNVQDIFTIVQGGQVPWITCQAEAPSLAELGKASNLVIQGAMVAGKIRVPGIHLDVDDARGEVVITRGMLYGKDLQGRAGLSTGQNGDLLVGLRSGNVPFHLGIDVDADLEQLHAILQEEIKSDSFHEEMTKVSDAHGRARGRMILGEMTRDIKAQVEVRDFNLSARYQRIPHAVSITSGQFGYRPGRVTLGDLVGNVGNSSLYGLSAWVDWDKEPYLKIIAANGWLSLNEAYPWVTSYPRGKELLKEFASLEGVLRLDGLDVDGPLAGSPSWRFQIKGAVENAVIKAAFFPGPLAVKSSVLEATPETLTFSHCQGKLLDASLEVAGAIHGYLDGLSRIELSAQGNLGAQAGHWVYDGIGLPAALQLRPPVAVSAAQGAWTRGGRTNFTGSFKVGSGLRLSLDGAYAPGELTLKNLAVKGLEADASLALVVNHKSVEVAYQGSLQQQALDQLLENNQILSGWIKGDWRTRLVWDTPGSSTAEGQLEMAGVRIPWKMLGPVQVDEASLQASGRELQIAKMVLSLEDQKVAVSGRITPLQKRLNLDLRAASAKLDWSVLESLWKDGSHGDSGLGSISERVRDLPLRGTISVDADLFNYGEVLWKPVQGAVLLNDGGLEIAVTHGGFCGIPTSGVIRFASGGMALDFQSTASDQELEPVLACLWDRKVTGRFDLNGAVTASGAKDPLVHYARGKVEFAAKDGRIYQLTVLAKILAILNVTEIFRGKLPDLAREGFSYESMKASGVIEDGHLQLKEAIIDGSSMKILGQGDVNLMNKELDLTVMVAPLKTADAVLSQIPIVGRIMTGQDGTLISIPFSVKGDLKDPKINALPPTAVGAGMLGILKRTLTLPVDIIQPLLSTDTDPGAAPETSARGEHPGQ